MDRPIRVLVVDDSAYVRKVLKRMLESDPQLTVVGTARDGEEALELVETLRPDVVTLDLMMPRKNGVQFLREQMARKPVPVVVVSIASESGTMALEAMEAGAVDFIQKPTALALEKMYDMERDVVEKVRAATGACLPALVRLTLPPTPAPPPETVPSKGAVDLVAVGVSTGGPQALRHVLTRLPADFPVPIAVVLHMPVGYTKLYADNLNPVTALQVTEAVEGDVLRPGWVYIAPAGRHMVLERAADGSVRVHLDIRPIDTLHRPSVDVLFQSAADVYGSRLLGVVMTGMGSDGVQGAAWIKAKGGLVFTEAEESCVIYGMPRCVVEAGLSDRQVPLEQLASALMEVV